MLWFYKLIWLQFFQLLFYLLDRIDQNVVVGAAGTLVKMGPMELLMDVPIEMGCFTNPEELDHLDESTLTTNPTQMTPAFCIQTCVNANKRFAGQNCLQNMFILLFCIIYNFSKINYNYKYPN